MKFKFGSSAFAEEHERMPGIKSVNYFRSKYFLYAMFGQMLFFNINYCYFSILFICDIIIWDMIISICECWEKGRETCGMKRISKGGKRVNIY